MDRSIFSYFQFLEYDIFCGILVSSIAGILNGMPYLTKTHSNCIVMLLQTHTIIVLEHNQRECRILIGQFAWLKTR